MLKLLISLLLTGSLLFGLVQRYLPFAEIVTKERKRRLDRCYIAAAVANVLAAYLLLQTLGMSVPLLNSLGLLFSVITTAVNIFVLRGRVAEHLFVFGVTIDISYIILQIPFYITGRIGIESSFWRPIVMGLTYLAVQALCFYPVQLLLRSTVTPFLQLDTGSYWTLIWFIPVALYISMVMLYPTDPGAVSFTSLVSGLITVVVILLMCLSISNDSKRMLETRQAEEQLKAQQIFFAEMKAAVEESRRSRHDLKHKLNAINYYLEKNDLVSLRQYCHELTEQTDRQAALHGASSALLDGVIFRYAHQAQKEDIAFICTDRHQVDWISDMDLWVLLGNALDNAFEACRLMEEDRRIALALHGDDHTLNILVQNTFNGQLDIRDGIIYSSKKSGRTGVGLHSLGDICRRYGGSMEYFAEDHLFSVNMVLRRPNA